MATYKKRGKGSKKHQQQEIDTQSTTAEVFNTLDETASKSEQWVEKNSKALFMGLIIVAAVIFAYLGYNKFVKGPQEVEAANELAYSKKFFDQAEANAILNDSLYNLALNGADGQYGLLDIIDNYGSTNAGNLAKYMAGLSYLKMDDYENAITHLGNFSTDDEIIGSQALGNIGDAFADINQPQQALEYYEKAAKFKTDNFATPLYLLKAGKTALELKDFKKAEDLFTKIKEAYSKSDEAADIDMYINRAKLAQQ